MKKTIATLITAVLILAGIAAAAQRPPARPQDVDAKLKKWRVALGLDDRQAAEIRKILESSGGPGEMGPPPGGDEMGPPPEGGMPPMGMGPGGMGMADREIEKVLSKAQASKFRTLRKAERVDEELARLVESLKLTPEQAGRVRIVLAANADLEAGMREAGPGDGPPDFEAMMALREKKDADIAALLTAEQKKLYEQTRRGPGRR